jgi:hypothetical protein
MITLVTDNALDVELAAARRRLADTAADMAQVEFDMDPSDVASWLDMAGGAATRREFVLPDGDEPQTLYLWMNDFEINFDRWFLTPFAMGHERAAEGEFDWRDALIGDEIGSGLRVTDLTLTGMEPVQEWFEQQAEAPEQSAVEDVVLLAAFDLVARSLPHTKDVPFRVAMSRGEEWRVCTWDTAEAAARVHTWRRSSD